MIGKDYRQIDGETAEQLASALDQGERTPEAIRRAQCGSYVFPEAGNFRIVSWTSGEDVGTCNGINSLFKSIAGLATGIYRVHVDGKTVVIHVPPDKGWRLFVNPLQSDAATG
jgi:hypothetical protein